jgi:ribosomal protein S18 acetylase RimI-like enzyme
MGLQIRDAVPADIPFVRVVGAAAGSSDIDAGYLQFVSREGRLVVAVDPSDESRVVGYAASIVIDGVTMISDLFVDPDAQGSGVGAELARVAVGGAPQVMTCSSQHPAAARLYDALGLRERGRLLYVAGSALGGGSPLQSAPWALDRVSLVEHFRSTGARVCTDVVMREQGDEVALLRLVHDRPVLRAREVLESLPRGGRVTACVVEASALASWLLDHGFEIIDHDVVRATDRVVFDTIVLDAATGCVHPGLW